MHGGGAYARFNVGEQVTEAKTCVNDSNGVVNALFWWMTAFGAPSQLIF